MNDVTRQKISKAMKGKKNALGHKMTDELKALQSERKRQWHNEHPGWCHSEESKKKMKRIWAERKKRNGQQ